MRLYTTVALTAAFTAIATAGAQVQTSFIDPVETDPRITPLDDFPDAESRNLGHFVAFDPTAPRPRLLMLYLPGSGGLPDDYETFAAVAAREGYHTVSIAYPNLPAVFELMQGQTDLDLPEAVRRERLFGDDLTDLIEVEQPDSVENRLIRLLQQLSFDQPGQGWGQYLNVNGTIRWNRVVVAGHSQGAGHAALLGKIFPLAGAIYLAGPGDAVMGETANWVTQPNVVNPAVCYGFTHWLDFGRNGFIERQRLLGLDDFGPIQSVDAIPAESLTSHMLTSFVLESGANYHSAIIVDGRMFLDDSGEPLYEPVWRYMLTEIRAASGACGGIACVCNVADPGDQTVDVLDLLLYLQWWYAGAASAERSGDAPANIDILDLLVFLECWFTASNGI